MGNSLFDYCEDDGRANTKDDRPVVAEIYKRDTQPKSETASKTRGTEVTARRLKQLHEQQDGRCALSGIVLTIETVELDHKIPLSDGGRHVMENVQLLHVDVNRMKGIMSQSDFVAMCSLIASNKDESTEEHW